jgi:putative ABC transport system permease protein
MMFLKIAFRNLFRNIRRSIAILLTIGLGAGALFAFQGFINGVLNDYRETTIHSHYGNGQFNIKGYRQTAYKEPWKHWIVDWEQIRSLALKHPSVKHVFPRISLGGMLMFEKVSITGQGQGIDAKEESAFFNTLNVEEGKNLSDEPNGILLGKGLAKALGVHPGDSITLYTKSVRGGIAKGKFVVTGIFHTGNVDFDNHVFRIQLKEAQKLLKTNQVEAVSLGLKDYRTWKEIAQTITKAIPSLEASSFAELDKVYYQHSVNWLEMQFYIVQIIILSIVLLGIFNTISSSILERKQEIGNLRANGESTFDVMKLILCEGAFLGIIGSLMGLSLIYLIAKGFLHRGILMPPGPGSTREFFISFCFTPLMTLKTFALSVISSLCASFFAGIRVAKMQITNALRAY